MNVVCHRLPFGKRFASYSQTAPLFTRSEAMIAVRDGVKLKYEYIFADENDENLR